MRGETKCEVYDWTGRLPSSRPSLERKDGKGLPKSFPLTLRHLLHHESAASEQTCEGALAHVYIAFLKCSFDGNLGSNQSSPRKGFSQDGEEVRAHAKLHGTRRF